MDFCNGILLILMFIGLIVNIFKMKNSKDQTATVRDDYDNDQEPYDDSVEPYVEEMITLDMLDEDDCDDDWD